MNHEDVFHIIYNIQKGKYSTFERLHLISPDNVEFILSMQAGPGMYSEPNNYPLPHLTDYESIELAFLKDRGDFIKPQEIGIELEDQGDDVYSRVDVDLIISLLVDFFAAGGRINSEKNDGQD